MSSFLRIADLSPDSISKIKKIEEETGFQIMAYEPEVILAIPTEDQLAKIKELEKELKVTLLAFEG